jgi:hypothetical protein
MAKTQTLADLNRIAIAKHGEDRAWALAIIKGNPRHKKTWQQVIDHPTRTPEEALKHQIWQEKIKKQLESE